MSDDERTPAKAAVGGAGTESVSGKKRSRSAIQGPLAPIATPLADKKLCKHVLKVVKKAAAAKVLRRGVKEVVKAVRKGESGCAAAAGRQRRLPRQRSCVRRHHPHYLLCPFPRRARHPRAV